jgi:hypothetical protein
MGMGIGVSQSVFACEDSNISQASNRNSIRNAETLFFFTKDRLNIKYLVFLIIGASSHMFIYFYSVHEVALLQIAPCETRVQNVGASERP